MQLVLLHNITLDDTVQLLLESGSLPWQTLLFLDSVLFYKCSKDQEFVIMIIS